MRIYDIEFDTDCYLDEIEQMQRIRRSKAVLHVLRRTRQRHVRVPERRQARLLSKRPVLSRRSNQVSKAIDDVLTERARQINALDYTETHDDDHEERELARAAECYVNHYRSRQWVIGTYKDGAKRYAAEEVHEDWPWEESAWKPKTPRLDLVRAAALIIAEIERLDRASSSDGAIK